MRLLAALLLSFSTLLSFSPAQAQKFDEKVTVEVVEVPVFVTRGDESVSGLTKEDFELFVNGQRREIEYFDVMLFDRPRAESEPPIDVHRRRLFLLLFDLDNTTYHSLRKAIKAADDFVREGAARGDAFAIATFAHGEMRFLVPFTNSEFAARRALMRLGGPFTASGQVHKPADEPSQDKTSEATARTDFNAEFSKDGPTQLPDTQNLERELSTSAGNDLIELLTGIADELQTLPGQKHVVLLSEGPNGKTLLRENLSAVVRMHDRFRAAGAFLHALGIKGMEAKSTLNITGLHTLALDTGGKVIQDTNNLNRALGSIREIQNVTYVLGFRQTVEESTRKRSTIKVRLKNKPWGTEVRFRKGFSAKAPDRELSRLYIAHVLANDVPHNEIGVQMFLAPRGRNIVVGAKIDGRNVTLASNGDTTMANVYLYVFDEFGSVVAWSEKKVAVDFAKAGEFYLTEKIEATHEFTFDPGKYSAKAFVHFPTLQLSGFGKAAFTIEQKAASR